MIRQIDIALPPHNGFIAHCGDEAIPVATLYDLPSRYTFIVPRAALPCELEMRGVLVTRISVTR